MAQCYGLAYNAGRPTMRRGFACNDRRPPSGASPPAGLHVETELCLRLARWLGLDLSSLASVLPGLAVLPTHGMSWKRKENPYEQSN